MTYQITRSVDDDMSRQETKGWDFKENRVKEQLLGRRPSRGQEADAGLDEVLLQTIVQRFNGIEHELQSNMIGLWFGRNL